MAEVARQSVRHLITPLVAASDDMAAVHDLMLGALAGVVECWVCCCNPGAGKERIAEALKGAIDDFVVQALEAQRGPIQ